MMWTVFVDGLYLTTNVSRGNGDGRVRVDGVR